MFKVWFLAQKLFMLMNKGSLAPVAHRKIRI